MAPAPFRALMQELLTPIVALRTDAPLYDNIR